MSKGQTHFLETHSFLALYYWGKFLGINPLTLTKEKRLKFSYLSLSYACFLSVTYCYLYYYFLTERLKISLPTETPISIIVDFGQINGVFSTILSTWLGFGFFQNRLRLIAESFARVDETSRKLEIPGDYERHFKKLGHYVTFVTALFVGVVIWNNIADLRFANYSTLIWTTYNVLRIPSITAIIVFVWSITVVRQKFHRLNEKVRFSMFDDRGEPRSLIEAGPCSEFAGNSSRDLVVFSNTIDTVSQLHRELVEVISRIKKHFDILVLIFIISTFPTMMVCTYITYMYVKKNAPMNGSDYMYVNSMLCWILLLVYALVALSNVCGSVLREANETGNILHAMLNNYENIETPTTFAKLTMLSFGLLHNRVRISLFGLLDIDELMIYKILGTAAMYFVMMLQFYN